MHVSESIIYAMWALTGSVIVLAVIIMYYRRKYKITKLVNSGGRSIIQISQDADSENIMMGIFYGPYEDRLPLNSIIPLEELVEEEDYTEPVYDLGRDFWNKVRDIRSVPTEEEARAIAQRLVELHVISEEDIPKFLKLDEEGRWHSAKEAEEEDVDGISESEPEREDEESGPEKSESGASEGPEKEEDREDESACEAEPVAPSRVSRTLEEYLLEPLELEI